MPFLNRSTLAYPATGAFPSGIWQDTRDPTSSDYKNFDIGVIWINFAAHKGWILVDKTATSGIWIQMASTGTGILDITGNTGGLVGADGSNNINLLGSGTITVTGTPVTHTLTISQDGTVATVYTEDSGTAVPLAGNLIIAGGTGVSTVGAGHTVTINAMASVPTSFVEDSGTAVPVANVLKILGGTGIATSGAGNTVTIAAAADIATQYTENSGTAVPSGNNLNVLGASGIVTSGAGATITITPGSTIATTYTEDSGSASPSGNNLNIVGGTAINTSGAGSTVTIATATTVATTYNGDTGSATPAAHAMTIKAGTATQRCGSSVTFTGSGSTLQLTFTDGNSNTLLGVLAGNASLSGIGNTACGLSMLQNLTSGQYNAGLGYQALSSVTSGSNNTGMGVSALAATTGSNNSAMGTNVLYLLVGGSYNSAFGNFAGRNYTGNESSNIVISNNGVLGESNVIRIGTQGTGNAQQNKCYIAGIYGVTTGVSGTTVMIDNTGNLGTIVSSRRYKKNIQDMADKSSDIYKLRPVTFNYISDESSHTQMGLIAEEVEEVFPNLIIYGPNGETDSVRYHDLPAMLLNELIKLRKEVEELKNKIC